MDWTRAVALLIAGIGIGALSAELAASPGDIHIVGAGGASLRAEPRLEAVGPMPLAAGQRLIEFRRNGAWLRVGLLGGGPAQGWVALSDVATPERTAQSPPLQAEDAASTPGGDGQMYPPFRLDITGRPGQRFKARCQLVDDEGLQVERRFGGQIAQQVFLDAAAVSCRVQKRDGFGRLTLRLWDGTVLVAEISTAAAFNSLAVRSDGPWGRSRSSRGRLRAIGLPSGSDGRSLQSLTGPLLKPLQ